MKIKTGYKVVVYRDDGLWSVYRSPYAVPYSYVWTVPQQGCGPLAVFSSLFTAIRFAMTIETAYIYRCEWIPWNGPLYIHPFRGKQAVWRADGYGWPMRAMPSGTRLACRVRLVGEPLYSWHDFSLT